MARYVGSIGVCGWLLISAQANAAGGPVFTVDLPIARPLAAAYSPSGAQVAVGGLAPEKDAPADGVVALMDAASGKQQFLLRHSSTIKDDSGGSSSSMNMVHTVAYSPDGKTLAVAAELGLKLWDPTDGKELATLVGYGINKAQSREEINSAVFSPDGKLLAAAGSENHLRLWDVVKREVVHEFEIGDNTFLAFSPDGTLFATAGGGNGVALWRVADGKQLAEVHGEIGPLFGVAIDRQCGRLVAVIAGGEKLWRIEKDAAGEWKIVDDARLTGPMMSEARHVAFSWDGRLFATADDYGALVVYDPQTRQWVGTLLAGGPFAFSPDGKSLAVAQWLTNQLPNGTQMSGTRFAIWKMADVLNTDRLAEQARTAAAEMVRTLTTPQPDRRMMQGVVTVLSGPQGEAATPILVDALKDPLVNEKNLVIFALGRIAERDPKARSAINDSLSTADEVDVRIAAVGVLSQLPANLGKEAVPALVEAALNDKNPNVRSAAAEILKKLDPPAFERVAAQVRQRGPVSDKVEQRDGKIVFQGRPLEEWIKVLSVSYTPNEIFGRPRPDEPLAAIRAIGADAVPVLIETLRSDEGPMRVAAAAGLEALGPQAAPAVEPLLEIISAAKENDLATTGAAADAIAAILKPTNEPPAKLLAMLQADEPAIRFSAARAVAQIQPNHARALQTLKAALDTNQRLMLQNFVVPFTPQPSLEWLSRTIADSAAPRDMRMRAAATLSGMGEKALPAMPGMLGALGEDDAYLSHDVELAIQGVGAKAIPAVRDALRTASSDRTRGRLASTLWGMGDEGRRAFKEQLTADDAETLWWAASAHHMDLGAAMGFQMAAREALQKLGQTVPPLKRQPLVWSKPVSPDGFGLFPDTRPTVKWLVQTLADREAPQQVRIQAANELAARTSNDEVLPMLPALLEAIGQEKDRSFSRRIEIVVERQGSKAVPAVRDALKKAPSDELRRRLTAMLSNMGDDGRRAINELGK